MTLSRCLIVAAVLTSVALAVIEMRASPAPSSATPSQVAADASGGTASANAGEGNPAASADPIEHDEAFDARLPALKDRHLDDDVDADIDNEEAAALRRHATELRDEIERIEGQARRGARALVETPEQLHKRLEETERRIAELDKRAGQLEYEASELQSESANAGDANAGNVPHPHHTIAPIDPLAAGLDDDGDDDDDDTDVD